MRSLSRVAGLAIACMIASGTLSAQTLLNDNFNGEDAAKASGQSSLGYTAFTNWSVSGNVDLVATPNNFTIVCDGKCVDLDGTTGPGSITTKLAYDFFAGDVMRFQFDVSGSQRGTSFDQFLVGFGFSAPTNISDFSSSTALVQTTGPASTSGVVENLDFGYSIGATQPFSTWNYQFTAVNDGSVSLTLGTTSKDNIGPVIDNVIIERVRDQQGATVPEPASVFLLSAGLLGLMGIARRRSTV